MSEMRIMRLRLLREKKNEETDGVGRVRKRLKDSTQWVIYEEEERQKMEEEEERKEGWSEKCIRQVRLIETRVRGWRESGGREGGVREKERGRKDKE